MSFGGFVVVCAWRHIFLKSLLSPYFVYVMLLLWLQGIKGMTKYIFFFKKYPQRHRGEKGASDSNKQVLKIQGEQS